MKDLSFKEFFNICQKNIKERNGDFCSNINCRNCPFSKEICMFPMDIGAIRSSSIKEFYKLFPNLLLEEPNDS